MASHVKSAIQLERDDRFQASEWRVQRFGWIVWVGILLAAALGFLGPGLFSQTRAAAEDRSLTVTYDRYVHFHHPTTLEVAFQLDASESESFEVSIDHALLERIDVQRIDPEPARSTITDQGIVYEFDKAAALRSGTLIFHIDYDRPGRINGRIGLVGHPPANVAQFVFP